VAIPQAIHVGLTGADAAIQSRDAIKSRIVHLDRDDQGASRVGCWRAQDHLACSIADAKPAIAQASHYAQQSLAHHTLDGTGCTLLASGGRAPLLVVVDGNTHRDAALLLGWSCT